MSVSPSRLAAISAANSFQTASSVAFKESHSAAIYGKNVFNDKVMQQRLPKMAYKSIRKTIDTGAPLDATVLDIVATAMKDPGLLAKLGAIGLDVIASTPEQLATVQRNDLAKWAKPVKASGFQAD